MFGKKSRSNKAQIRMLVNFMSANNYLAIGEHTGPMDKRRAEVQWLKLKNLLKNHGPDRTVDQWKQTWKDLKKNARHENALSVQAQESTEDPDNFPIMSENSRKILDTIRLDSSTGIGPLESTIGPISKTETPPKKCWDNKSQMRLIQIRAARSHSLDSRTGGQSAALGDGLDPSADPLMPVKQEAPRWLAADDDSNTASKEFEVEVSLGSPASPPRDSPRPADHEYRLSPPLAARTQGSKSDDDRCQMRIEELHKLKVEEQVWMLKTSRERHATAQLERERSQLEKQRAQEENEKAKLEREKARFERDMAEFQREKALLELDRAKRADSEIIYTK